MSNEVKSTQYIGGKIEKVNIINNMPVQDGSISNGGISGEDYTEFKNAASRSTENAADIADLTAAQESDHAEIGELKQDLVDLDNRLSESKIDKPTTDDILTIAPLLCFIISFTTGFET